MRTFVLGRQGQWRLDFKLGTAVFIALKVRTLQSLQYAF